MQINICKTDDTQYWSSEIVKKVGKIYSVYLYNPEQYTYCCELTPSYELNFAGITISGNETFDKLDEFECEELFETLRDAVRDCDDVAYYHVSFIENLPTLSDETEIKTGKILLGDFEDLDEALEYVHANGFTI